MAGRQYRPPAVVVRVDLPAWACPRNRMMCCAAARESTVIIRLFRPTIRSGKEAEFEAFLRDVAIPLVSRQPGLVAQHIGRPRDGSSTEFVYVTVWQDVESIRTFAGERWQEAVITPDEEHLLQETWIGHYEVLPSTE
jgi:antibiotic biosynthesis monooxygenase (ABM) superfamily enzyme